MSLMTTPRPVRALALLWLAALSIAACSRDSDDATSEPVSPAPPAPTTVVTTTTSTPACTPSAGYEPGTTERRLDVAGVERAYLVDVPARPSTGMALVLNFHGANSDMVQQAAYSGFDRIADSEGFVVAYPNGIDAPVRQWRFLGTTDDIDFATAVVDDLVANACVDPARAFAVGISSGAAMSASLACQASDRFAGFGLVAADFYVPAICDAAEPRPIVIFHGTADATVPYAGGMVGGLTVAPAEQSANAWATHNGCTGGPAETTIDAEVVRLAWSGCEEPVVMYRVVGGGHTWPGAAIAVERLGATTDQIDATAQMWEFFSGNG